jgi:hypothetical protein
VIPRHKIEYGDNRTIKKQEAAPKQTNRWEGAWVHRRRTGRALAATGAKGVLRPALGPIDLAMDILAGEMKHTKISGAHKPRVGEYPPHLVRQPSGHAMPRSLTLITRHRKSGPEILYIAVSKTCAEVDAVVKTAHLYSSA